MIHIVVLATAGAISSYSAIDRTFFPTFHPGAVPAIAAQAVAVGDLSLGGDSVIIKPLSIPTSALLSRAPILDIIGRDDTLEGHGQPVNLSCAGGLVSNPRLPLPPTVG